MIISNRHDFEEIVEKVDEFNELFEDEARVAARQRLPDDDCYCCIRELLTMASRNGSCRQSGREHRETLQA